MIRLFTILLLLFSFNGWADEDEKRTDNSIFFTDDDNGYYPPVSNYDGSITCFNASKEIIDLDNLSIDDERLTGNNKYIEYSYKDLFRNIKSGRIAIASGTTCNIIYDTTESSGEYDPFNLVE